MAARINRLRGVAALALLLALPAADAAGVYKWVDHAGIAHYDDQSVTSPRLTEDDLDQRRIDPRPQNKAPVAFAEQVQQQCVVARVRLDNYRRAGSLYGQDPAGNVYPLSPNQVRLSIAESERDEARFCAAGAADAEYAAQLAALRKPAADSNAGIAER